MKNGEIERKAAHHVDETINRLLSRRRYLAPFLPNTPLTPTEHRSIGTAVTPARVAAQAMDRIRLEDRELFYALAYRQLQQIARSRLNVEFHVLLQAQATVGCKPAAIIAGRTIVRQAA